MSLQKERFTSNCEIYKIANMFEIQLLFFGNFYAITQILYNFMLPRLKTQLNDFENSNYDFTFYGLFAYKGKSLA